MCFVACNKGEAQNPTPEHIHNFGEWSVTQNATCTENGVKTRYCSCGEKQSDTIPSTGHNFGNWVTVKEATTTEEGLREQSCICGEKKSETIAIVVPSFEELEFTLNEDGNSYSVTGIGTCTDTDIVIPSTYEGKPVTAIGAMAFAAVDFETSTIIPSSISSVTIPNSVTIIGDYAFVYCTSLRSITLGDSITDIGSYAFSTCVSLVRITIPRSAINIGTDAFSGCTSLIEICNKSSLDITAGSNSHGRIARMAVNVIDDDSQSCLKFIGDYVFYDDGTNVYLVRYFGEETEITLPEYDGGKPYALYYGSFVLNDKITSVTIPDSVIGICGMAGYGGSFTSCTSLTSVILPDSLTSIGGLAFYRCTSLTNIEIPNSIKIISREMFVDCTSLEKIIIPASVTNIDFLALEGCSSLLYIEFKGTIEQWNSIIKDNDKDGWNGNTGSYTIYCTNGEIAKDGTITYYEVVSQGLEFTLNGDGISYSVTGIGTCTDTDIVIPSTYNNLPVTNIGENSFKENNSIRSLVTGENVTSIGDSAFENCKSLKTLIMADSLISIGEYAFSNCSSLANVSVGENFKKFTLSAFYYCYALSNIEVDVENMYYSSIDGSLYDKSGTILLRYAVGKTDAHFTIPDTVTRINEQALYGASYLTSITIPNSVSSIGDYAFYDCRSLIEVCNKSQLNIIVASENYGRVGYYAKRIITDESQSAIKIEGDYVFFDDGTDVYFLKYIGNEKDIILPKYDGGKEYGIWHYAFWNNWLDAKIATITIPEGVTSIGVHAFSYCYSLINISIPNSITNIDNCAFFYCKSLASVIIPDSVTSIGDQAFYGCTSLKDVHYAGNIDGWLGIVFGNDSSHPTYYGANLYFDGELVTTVTIPDSVTSIVDYAFYGCTSLQSITISDSVTSIGDYAFCGCTSLQSITLPDSLKNIGYRAFLNCTSLQFNKYDNALYLGNENNPYLVLIKAANQSITSCKISNTTKFIYNSTYYSGGNTSGYVQTPTGQTQIIPTDTMLPAPRR